MLRVLKVFYIICIIILLTLLYCSEAGIINGPILVLNCNSKMAVAVWFLSLFFGTNFFVAIT